MGGEGRGRVGRREGMSGMIRGGEWGRWRAREVVEGSGYPATPPPAVISKHGKDCEALAMALEGKTVAQCRNFFTNYKRKLNLPRFIAEYELKNVSVEE